MFCLILPNFLVFLSICVLFPANRWITLVGAVFSEVLGHSAQDLEEAGLGGSGLGSGFEDPWRNLASRSSYPNLHLGVSFLVKLVLILWFQGKPKETHPFRRVDKTRRLFFSFSPRTCIGTNHSWKYALIHFQGEKANGEGLGPRGGHRPASFAFGNSLGAPLKTRRHRGGLLWVSLSKGSVSFAVNGRMGLGPLLADWFFCGRSAGSAAPALPSQREAGEAQSRGILPPIEGDRWR